MYFPAPAPNLYLPALASDSYLPALGPNLCLPALAPNLYLTALAPNMCLPPLAPNLYLAALVSNLLFTSSGHDFTTTVTDTCTITTTTITTTATTTTTNTTSTTRDNNKKCLHGSKIHIKWPLKDIDEKRKFCFSKFARVMANVSLNRGAAAVKEIGGWLILK